MPQRLFAFAIPLGPADPGLENEEERKQEARRLASTVMPSCRRLIGSLLKERIMSDGQQIWLAFDLEENPQGLLDFGRERKKRQAPPSVAQQLYAEIEVLKCEAENVSIRLGELDALSKRLTQSSDPETTHLLDSLSEDDRLIWQLSHSRPGKQISIRFDGQEIGTTLPLFPVHLPAKNLIRIQFRVITINRTTAQITGVKVLDNGDDRSSYDHKSLANLKKIRRSPGGQHDRAWFCLYAAEFYQETCRSTVRLALRSEDSSLSHGELVTLEDLDLFSGLGSRVLCKKSRTTSIQAEAMPEKDG